MAAATSPPTPRQRRRQARLDAILAAALELLVAEGLDGLTTARLADAVDLTPGALYRYFPSKDAIIAALQSRVIEELHGVFRWAWGQAEGSSAARGLDESARALFPVVLAAHLYTKLPTEAPTRFGLLALAVGEPRQLVGDAAVGPVIQSVLPLLADVGGRLEGAAALGALSVGPAPVRAVTLWASLHGVMMMRKFARFDPGVIQADALARGLTRDLLKGWGADAEALARAEAAVMALMARSSLVEGGLAAKEGV